METKLRIGNEVTDFLPKPGSLRRFFNDNTPYPILFLSWAVLFLWKYKFTRLEVIKTRERKNASRDPVKI